MKYSQYTAVTPWIISPSSVKMIEFMTAAFGAEEVPHSKITNADGVVIHVVAKIADPLVMLFDSREGWPPTPAFLSLYVDDIETVLQRALRTVAALSYQVLPNITGQIIISTVQLGYKLP